MEQGERVRQASTIWATPAARLGAVMLFGLLVIAAAVSIVVSRPSLGLSFALSDDGQHVQAGFSDGAVRSVAALSAGLQRVALAAIDLTPEPGELAGYADLHRFQARQQALADILSAGTVTLTADGQEWTLEPRPRGLAGLSGLFWIQAVVGFGALAIAGWVWSLRPGDLASRLFAASGVCTLAFTVSAAIYSTRELALDSGLFKALTAINLVGSVGFGIAMILLFLVYPRRLVGLGAGGRGVLLAVAGLFGVWMALALAEALPNPQLGGNLATVVEMAGIVAAIAAQYFSTRKDPAARAALTWLGLSVIIGAGAFIVLSAAPSVLGFELPMLQAYAFLFFLIIYLGLAAGLRRYRLFEVGEWGFRILFYAAGALVLLLLDAALVFWLHVDRLPAIGVALLAVGFLYLPLRDLLWRRMTGRRGVAQHVLFAAALDVAFAPTSGQRADRWRALLQQFFDPLEMSELDPPVTTVAAASDGLTLLVPPVAGAPSLRLAYPWGGRGLFAPAHLTLARQVLALIDRAEQGRDAYDRGVAEERRRMAQDLHDDVGARLLTGMHMADERMRPTLQAALSDIRAIVVGMTGDRIPLDRLLADVRHEAARRLEAAEIALDWPLRAEDDSDFLLDYRLHKAITSAVREAVSNVIRHSGASHVTVAVTLDEATLRLSLADNGRGLSPEAQSGATTGYGLRSLRKRIADIGGSLEILSSPQGTVVMLLAPLRPGLSDRPPEQGMAGELAGVSSAS